MWRRTAPLPPARKPLVTPLSSSVPSPVTSSPGPVRPTRTGSRQPSQRRSRVTALVSSLALATTVVATAPAAGAAPADAAAPAPPKTAEGASQAAEEAPQTAEEAPQTAEEAKSRLEDVTARLAASERREGEAQARAEQLTREAEETARRLAGLRLRLGDRARAVYTGGLAAEPLVALLTSDRPTAVVDRMTMLDAAQGHENDVLDRTLVEQKRLERQRAAAGAAVREAATARDELTRSAAELDALLRRLVAEEEAARARAAEEAARAAALTAAGLAVDAAATGVTAANGQACPVGPVHSFVDSWGAARSGGRAHKGTDVMAPYGAAAFAVVDGTVTRAGSNGLGGIVLYLTGANGDRYYYAHNAVNLVGEGQRVVAGQEIAKVGNSGNAAGGAAHIHFEVHPGGGAPVNPYPFLRGVCG